MHCIYRVCSDAMLSIEQGTFIEKDICWQKLKDFRFIGYNAICRPPCPASQVNCSLTEYPEPRGMVTIIR